MSQTIEMLYSKLHRATVTQADLAYEGSLTIDRDLMDAANFIENQRVHIYNITNGERIETYVIEGERGSGVICANGGAAHKIRKDDKVIIVAYTTLDLATAKNWQPTVVLLDDHNVIKEIKPIETAETSANTA